MRCFSHRLFTALRCPHSLVLDESSKFVGSLTLKRPDRHRAEAALWRVAKAEDRAPTSRQFAAALPGFRVYASAVRSPPEDLRASTECPVR